MFGMGQPLNTVQVPRWKLIIIYEGDMIHTIDMITKKIN